MVIRICRYPMEQAEKPALRLANLDANKDCAKSRYYRRWKKTAKGHGLIFWNSAGSRVR